MANKRYRFREGVTLIELIIASLSAVILLVGITAIVANGHKNYKTMYNRINSEVVRNAYEAKILFDKIVRHATIRHSIPSIGTSNELYVYYYSNPSDILSLDPDRYARFYVNNGALYLRRGGIIPGTWNIDGSVPTTDMSIASNVSSVQFLVKGTSVRMVLILDNETDPQNVNPLETLKMTVTSTAIRHNQ